MDYGQRDSCGERRQRARNRYPKATCVLFANAGHIAWKQDALAFQRVLADFWKTG